MKAKYFVFLLFNFSLITITANPTDDFFKQSDLFFSNNIQDGKVMYKALKSNPVKLDKLLQLVATADTSIMNDATFKAFYINAYNLYVIKGVLDNYPVGSPLDIKGFFDKKTYVVGSKKVTLNTIENTILRKKYPDEPRFHFVLVCAGLGCPPIIPEAYTPEKLEMQLQRQATIALNDPAFIKVKGDKVRISQIFEWYKEDFTKKGTEIEFINKYRDEKIPVNANVSYYSYNWKLNDAK